MKFLQANSPLQKQPPALFCKKRCSQKFCKFLIKKSLWHGRFPVNLRTPFFKEHLCEFPSRVNASEFHEDKAFILIDIPFCKRIKINLKNLSKSSTVHKSKILYSIKWITKNVKSLKDKNRKKKNFSINRQKHLSSLQDQSKIMFL